MEDKPHIPRPLPPGKRYRIIGTIPPEDVENMLVVGPDGRWTYCENRFKAWADKQDGR